MPEALSTSRGKRAGVSDGNWIQTMPGTPPYKVSVGAAVEVTFEEVAPGQLIHKWRVVA